jgi:hypothetical protein
MGRVPRRRLAGSERRTKGGQLAAQYAAGDSIRTVARQGAMSITLTRSLLKEAGVQFRNVGGANHVTGRG